jgi:putative transposase
VEILEEHLMQEHIHTLVSIPQKMSVSSFMGYLRYKGVLMIFDKHTNLGIEGYYVSIVSLNEATIRKYIKE